MYAPVVTVRLKSSIRRPVTEVGVCNTKLDVEGTFCYLGHMLCSGGSCDSAITARCCVAWGKFRKLLPVLIIRHLSPKVHIKAFVTCICLAMLHNRPISQIPECICAISHNAPFCNRNVHTCAHFCYKMLHCGIWHRCILGFVRWVYCKTWGPNASDLQRLDHNHYIMICWICGTKDRDETPSASLLQQLEGATSCIKSATHLVIPYTRRWGRHRKMWSACVKNHVRECQRIWPVWQWAARQRLLMEGWCLT